jgi:8-oxo-dGTP diphosphatase
VIHVAVGVVYDKQGNILLTQRPAHKDQGGLWEFAGGKVEQGETVLQALHREFEEELGIQPKHTRPLIKIPFTYPEYSVLLDVWEVLTYEGDAYPRENQAMRWVHPKHLTEYDFPAANRAIIRAAQLPHYYLITPDQEMPLEVFAAQLRRCFSLGIRLCRVRQGMLSEAVYAKRVHVAIELAHEVGARVIVDFDAARHCEGKNLRHCEGVARSNPLQTAGVHLTSQDLYHYQTRPVPDNILLVASLHTEQDVLQANKIQVDCSVLSPVKSTCSHPHSKPLGWEKFSSIIEQAQHPVYALGGLGIDDLLPARSYGAQGIAAIRSLWEIKERV